jgi:cholesterol oxidase
MAEDAKKGVSDFAGEVYGCPGLFVMDAAAFPRSVGVNPSATIAAVAEYKVERFIRKRLDDEQWTASQLAEARAWAEAKGDELDPIGAMRVSSKGRQSTPPSSRPIGIAFTEGMKGCHGEIGGAMDCEIETKLYATIDDLSSYLEYHRRGEPQEIRVQGEVRIDGLAGISQPLEVVSEESYMVLFADPPRDDCSRERRTIEYRLVMEERGAGPAAAARRFSLRGSKTIRDDERFDLWEDSTTLHFTLSKGSGTSPIRQGILRVPACDFFGVQLPSFEATNTDDPARQSWALAAFGKFFFGHLVDIYVPELDRVVDVVKSIGERSHV